jgi:hypothetical protein
MLIPTKGPAGSKQVPTPRDPKFRRRHGQGRDMEMLESIGPKGLVSPQSTIGSVVIPKARRHFAIVGIVGIVGFRLEK